MTEATGMTEINLLVGSMFDASPDEDRELYEQEREWLYDVQDLLREEGIEVDLLSRPGVDIWEGGIERFADLHRLWLLAAYLENGRDVKALLSSDDALEQPDPLLDSIWEGEKSTRYPHLLIHQPESGYYLPVDFAEPIVFPTGDEDEDAADEEDDEGGIVTFGSSMGLQRELVDLEERLRQAGVPESNASFRCLRVLRTAADQSVGNDLPIIDW